MEDRDVSDYEDHSTQLGMLPQFGQCDRVMLSAIPTSGCPGETTQTFLSLPLPFLAFALLVGLKLDCIPNFSLLGCVELLLLV